MDLKKKISKYFSLYLKLKVILSIPVTNFSTTTNNECLMLLFIIAIHYLA